MTFFVVHTSRAFFSDQPSRSKGKSCEREKNTVFKDCFPFKTGTFGNNTNVADSSANQMFYILRSLLKRNIEVRMDDTRKVNYPITMISSPILGSW